PVATGSNGKVPVPPAAPSPGQTGAWGDDDTAIPTAIPSAAPNSATFAPARSAASSATMVAPPPARPMRDPDDVTDGADAPPTKDRIEYVLPPITALEDIAIPLHAGGDEASHKRNEEIIVKKLAGFGIPARIVARNAGPVVTQYEVQPAPDVKLSRVEALSDDLAMALAARSLRIEAPIPGKSAVGIEIPNADFNIVALRRILEDVDFKASGSTLTFALGRDVAGKAQAVDLAKMPHLLIAGATGSGKSVCVNTIITSLAYRHTPRTLRFLMVDPKMVELSVYNTLPHLRHKVITDNRDAASVLKWAVMEMQDRYRLLEANACRNLQEFNRRVQQHADGEGASLQKPRNLEVAFEDRTYTGGVLPYIVVVIDEMADLMMTVQGEVETPIAMLAQKARAIGIHLILATQRPSVNVITGLIKANFPCRIAFRVASQVDSRTIIDGAGAEALLGNGDMLFLPPGKSEPARLQGAYLSSEDTERLLKWYEDARARHEAGEGITAEPDILETVRALEAKGDGGDDEDGDRASDERDVRFREAAEVVIQHRQGSTSLLQRRLKIGYGRAARIIDQLEAAGVLSPTEGAARPREVLVGAQDLDRICGS
ncbi:DNA translocase FtsK, partial [Gemmatimonas sp.]|uniref:DNA translocase FtsK n=1 Tax=Gemmatimonas sp. TaxID=1962908 RepID=UPI003983A04C